VKTILELQRRLQLQRNVAIAIGNPPKTHRFDLASKDDKVVIECKSVDWTETGNVLSGKMGHYNQAVFYLSFLADVSERYLAMPKAPHPSGKETLARYYWRT
jgi:hypothetical protein